MSKLIDLMAECLELSPSVIQTDLKMVEIPNWDSLAHMRIISGIEQRFQIELSVDEIIEMTSIVAIKTILKNKNVDVSL